MDEHQEHQHHRLVEEIATRVEEKLVAKFARLLVFNFVAILGMVVAAASAYYTLDNRISDNKRLDEMQDRIIQSIQDSDVSYRREVLTEIHELRRLAEERDRWLRDKLGNHVK